MKNRQQEIVRTGYLGIGTNVLVAAGKAAVGAISGSMAIVLDAVNNLTDALSSVITIIGVKLAGRPADDSYHEGCAQQCATDGTMFRFLFAFVHFGPPPVLGLLFLF